MSEPIHRIPELSPEEVRERTVQVPQIAMMYFNYVRVAASFFDMRMFFGQGNVTPKGEQMFTEELCVTCSVEFAKILRDNLTTQIDSYEKKFGKLREPKKSSITSGEEPRPTKKHPTQ